MFYYNTTNMFAFLCTNMNEKDQSTSTIMPIITLMTWHLLRMHKLESVKIRKAYRKVLVTVEMVVMTRFADIALFLNLVNVQI